MKILLAENIIKYRKENKMTQEMLADKLGVTFASVSKWERGLATPDLSLIVEMASLFQISVDALIGYDIEENTIEKMLEEGAKYIFEKRYEKTIELCKSALLKYPNNFKVVSSAASAYYLAGLELTNKEYLNEAIKLLERTITLLNQNDDPEVNEIVIQGYIADCYIFINETKKGTDILKKNNVKGVFDAQIAYSLTETPGFDLKDASPYIDRSMTTSISSLTYTIIALVNYNKEIKAYNKIIDILSWFYNLLESLKIKQDVVSVNDKYYAFGFALCAEASLLKGSDDEAIKYLKLAYEKAKIFDANPTYKLNNFKYIINREDFFAVDPLGKTANESVERIINRNDKLKLMWNNIIKEGE